MKTQKNVRVNHICRQFRDRGSTLVLVVFAVVVLSAAGVGLLGLGLRSRVYAVRTSQEIEARCAADAGVTQALFMMNEKLKVKPWSDSTLPQATGETLPNCDAVFGYTVTADAGSGYVVDSTGTCVAAAKNINATLRLQGPFESAILTRGKLTLKSGTVVSGYNSSDPGDTNVEAQIATTSTSSGQIVLNSGVTVNGDVFVGVGADPAVVIKDLGASTWRRSAMTEEVVLPKITPPNLATKGSISVKGVTLPVTPADSGQYLDIELKGSKDPGILRVDGGQVVLYVTGTVDMGEGCEIVINNGASLTMYLDGNLTAGNNSGFNNLTKVPDSLRIYGTGSAGQCIDIKAKSDVFGAVYAPNATVNVYAKGDVYGSIVASEFEFKAGGNFYYDKALRDVSADDEAVRFLVTRWSEQ